MWWLKLRRWIFGGERFGGVDKRSCTSKEQKRKRIAPDVTGFGFDATNSKQASENGVIEAWERIGDAEAQTNQVLKSI